MGQSPTTSSTQTASSLRSSGSNRVTASPGPSRPSRCIGQTTELQNNWALSPQQLWNDGGCVLPASLQAPCTPAWTPRAWDLPLLLLPQRPALSAHLRDRSSANVLLENRPWPCDVQARMGLLRCTLTRACTHSHPHKRIHVPAHSQHQCLCHHRRA